MCHSSTKSLLPKYVNLPKLSLNMGSAPSKQNEPQQSTPLPEVKVVQVKPADNAESDSNIDSSNFPSDTLQTLLEPPPSATSATRPHSARNPGKGETSKYRILVCYHSKDETVAKSVENKLSEQLPTVNVLSLNEEESLEYREAIVRISAAVVLVVSYTFQQNFECQEITNYTKDCGKKVVMAVVQKNYDPTGVVGAVGKAYGEIVYLNKGEPVLDIIVKVKKLIALLEPRPEIEMPEIQQSGKVVKPEKIIGNDNTIYISYADGASAKVATIVRNGESCMNNVTQYGVQLADNVKQNKMSDYTVLMGSINSLDKEKITSCRVFVPVVSVAYQNSSVLKQQFELARSLGKNIVAVKAEKFVPTGWLALAMAGKLFYEMKDKNEAYRRNPKINQTNKMNDFLVAVRASLNCVTDECRREKLMKEKLEVEINDIKLKLKKWPPKDYSTEFKEEPYPSKMDLLPEEENTVRYMFIPEHLTKFTFDPLYDNLGLPLEKYFDCMLSYQWEIQAFVQRVYEELNFRQTHVWMDMEGGMVGNINDAMARAVEAAASVIVFLTAKYQNSVNCNLELRYAVALGKPLIFVVAEQNFKPLDWIQSLMDKFLVLTMITEFDMGMCQIKGYPNIVVLSSAARKISEWKVKQKKQIPLDVSEEIYQLLLTLENAKWALSEEEGRSRYLTCTRCETQFEESDKSGCKKHTTYYMGGNLMTGRWWCCQQTEVKSLGCCPTDHITENRTYGPMEGWPCCKVWTPA